MNLITIGSWYDAHAPFANLFKDVLDHRHRMKITPEGEESFVFKPEDVILFGGGSDISPTLYKQKPNRYCGAGALMSERDQREKKAFDDAFKMGLPMLGICRGAQLLCALSGGSLYQHVVNHGVSHPMTTKEGTVIKVSSVHHQMMNPFNTKHELIGWASEVISNCHLIENDQNIEVEIEPEIVYFHDTKALAIQYHPEFMNINEPAVQYARSLVQQYLIGE